MKITFLLLLFILAITVVKGQEIGIASSELTTIVKTGDKFAIKDGNERIILSDIDSIGSHNKQDVYIIKNKNKYGMYSLYGNEIIPIQFDKINRLYNQFWIVESNNKKGIYNIYSKKSLPTIFDEINFSSKVGVEFIVKKENKFGIYNDEFEEIVPVIYDKIETVGIIELSLKNEKSYMLNGKILNKNILVDKTFHIHGQYLSDTKTYYIYVENNKLGIIDENDSIILKPKYVDIIPKLVQKNNFIPANIFFVKYDEKWGMIDLSNKVIAPIEFESIAFGSDDYLIVGKNGTKQFYNLKLKNIIDKITFDKYFYLGKYSRIEKSGQETLINNITMKLVFPFKFENIMYLDDSNYFSVKKDGKYGIVDINDKVIIPLVYEELTIFSCGNKAVVKKDGKYGIVDIKNKILLPFTERYIIAYSDRFERQKENSFEMEVFDCEFTKIKK